MVASLHRSGQTVRGFLDELYQRYGYFQVKYILEMAGLDSEHLLDEQWLFRLLRPTGRAADFFATTQLRRNGELVRSGLL